MRTHIHTTLVIRKLCNYIFYLKKTVKYYKHRIIRTLVENWPSVHWCWCQVTLVTAVMSVQKSVSILEVFHFKVSFTFCRTQAQPSWCHTFYDMARFGRFCKDWSKHLKKPFCQDLFFLALIKLDTQCFHPTVQCSLLDMPTLPINVHQLFCIYGKVRCELFTAVSNMANSQ